MNSRGNICSATQGTQTSTLELLAGTLLRALDALNRRRVSQWLRDQDRFGVTSPVSSTMAMPIEKFQIPELRLTCDPSVE